MLMAILTIGANGLLPCALILRPLHQLKSPGSTDMLACSLLSIPSASLLSHSWKAALIANEVLDCPSRNAEGSLKTKFVLQACTKSIKLWLMRTCQPGQRKCLLHTLSAVCTRMMWALNSHCATADTIFEKDLERRRW